MCYDFKKWLWFDLDAGFPIHNNHTLIFLFIQTRGTYLNVLFYVSSMHVPVQGWNLYLTHHTWQTPMWSSGQLCACPESSWVCVLLKDTITCGHNRELSLWLSDPESAALPLHCTTLTACLLVYLPSNRLPINNFFCLYFIFVGIFIILYQSLYSLTTNTLSGLLTLRCTDLWSLKTDPMRDFLLPAKLFDAKKTLMLHLHLIHSLIPEGGNRPRS